MAKRGIGYFKGRWIGDTDAVGFKYAGRAMGVETRSKPEAKAMFDYLQLKKREPEMFSYAVNTVMGGRKTVYAVYWRKKDIKTFMKDHPNAKPVKR